MLYVRKVCRVDLFSSRMGGKKKLRSVLCSASCAQSRVLGFWSSLPAGLRPSRGLDLRIIGIGKNGGGAVLKQTTGVFPLIFSKAGYKF